MCLYKVERKGEWKRAKKAWGVFEARPDGTVETPVMCVPIEVDVKMRAEFDVAVAHFDGQTYDAGFHKFATEEDAKGSWIRECSGKYFICPVYLSGKYTVGTEGIDPERRVYVAEYMVVRKKDLEKAMARL